MSADLDMVADAAWQREMKIDRFEYYLLAIARQLGIAHAAPFALDTRIASVARLWREQRGPFAGQDADGQWEAARRLLIGWAKQNGIPLE